MLNQWAPNYGWSHCLDCGETYVGEWDACFQCFGENMAYYERVVGYLVNRDVVNHGRELEMLNRVRHLTPL